MSKSIRTDVMPAAIEAVTRIIFPCGNHSYVLVALPSYVDNAPVEGDAEQGLQGKRSTSYSKV